MTTYPTWIKGRIQAFNDNAVKTLQRIELKMFGTREENGVSTPHVLSMRSYARTQAKHAKEGLFIKTCYFTLFGA